MSAIPVMASLAPNTPCNALTPMSLISSPNVASGSSGKTLAVGWSKGAFNFSSSTPKICSLDDPEGPVIKYCLPLGPVTL